MKPQHYLIIWGFLTAFLGYLLETVSIDIKLDRTYYLYKILYHCGSLIAQIYAATEANHNETLQVVMTGIFSMSLFTVFTEHVINKYDDFTVIIGSILTSLYKGLILPGLAPLICRWAPLKARTTIGAFVYVGTIFGMTIRILLNNTIFEQDNGYTQFYIIGACGLVWSICIMIAEYRKYGRPEDNNLPPVPWYHMLTSVPLWSLIAAQVGHSWLFRSMINYLSSDSTAAHLYPYNIMYYIAMLLCCLMVSWLADQIINRKLLSITNVRKLCISGGTVLSGFIFISMYYIANERSFIPRIIALLCFTLLGCGYSSLKINAIDLSPNYAGTIVGISDGISTCLVDWLLPYFINMLNIYDLTANIWIGFGLITATNIPYFIFGRGDVQPWN